MLSESCRRFQEGFGSGGRQASDPHVAECPECQAWAEEVSSLRSFGADLPLPAKLRADLVAIARSRHDEEGEPLEADALQPLPQLPLPEGLRDRLAAIPAARRRQPPVWITKARYGVAASYLLAALLVSYLGSSLASAQQTAGAMSRRVDTSLQSTELKGSRTLDRLETSAQTGLNRLKSTAQTSLGQLVLQWTEVRKNLLAAPEGASPRKLGENDAEQPAQTR